VTIRPAERLRESFLRGRGWRRKILTTFLPENATPLLLAGWELFTGAGTAEDAARVGLLLAISRRLTDAIMLLVARQRRGEGDELLSPLIMPALAVGEALTGLLDAAAHESGGEDEQPRRELFTVVEQLRGMAELLETMTPEQYRTAGPARHPPTHADGT